MQMSVHRFLLYYSVGVISVSVHTFCFLAVLCTVTLDDPKWTNLILRGIIIVCVVKVILWGAVLTA